MKEGSGKRRKDGNHCSCEKMESERSSEASHSCDINTNHYKQQNGNHVSFVEYKSSREKNNVPKLRFVVHRHSVHAHRAGTTLTLRIAG
jgi:hypothetical protein